VELEQAWKEAGEWEMQVYRLRAALEKMVSTIDATPAFQWWFENSDEMRIAREALSSLDVPQMTD
jgi:hypothetical protein